MKLLVFFFPLSFVKLYAFHFQLNIGFLSAANCGGIFTNSSGRFASPLFPNNYPNNMECVYIIQVADDKKIELRFDR